MNLLALTTGTIGEVNPRQSIVWKASTGNVIGADGSSSPQYAAPVTLDGQVQPLQYKDLQQIDSLNLQGTRRKVYLYGVKEAIVRSLQKGGDLLTDVDGNTWLVAMVIEQWPDWCAVAVTLQND